MVYIGGKGKAKEQSPQLSIEQCEELKKPPYINPLTKRKLNPSALNGMYKKLIKDCDEIEKGLLEIIKQNPMKQASTVQVAEPKASMLSASRMKKLKQLRLRMALRNALKPILNRMDTHDNRIYFAKVIRKYNKHILPCVQASQERDNTLALVQKNTYVPVTANGSKQKSITKVKEIIYFKKRIGTESAYGTAYMNTGRGIGRALKFSIKIMSTKFNSEVNLLLKMSKLAETKVSPNMPITYDFLLCTDVSATEKANIDKKIQNVTNIIKQGFYYVVLSELANGDMHDFFLTTHTSEIYESVILQVLISLSTFHSYIGYVHNDAHLGNFLFHKIPPGGYWHYVIEKKDFKTKKVILTDMFVPNTGYLVVLWDPGVAQPIYNTPFIDYKRVLSLMTRINSINMYIDKGMKPIPSHIFEPFNKIYSTMSFSYDNFGIYTPPFQYIMDHKDKLFKHIYFDKKNLPATHTILNDKPYILHAK